MLIGGPGGANLISGNLVQGILVEAAIDVTIQSNLIGTDVNGTAALGNGGAGIKGGGPGLVIGGTGAGEGNLVSGNSIGMDLLAEGMTVQGNAVGVDDSGIAPLPNGGHGIKLGSPGTAPNIIGTAAPGGPGANHIAYNLGRGIFVAQGAHHTMRGNSIHDNVLGIDLAGTGADAQRPPRRRYGRRTTARTFRSSSPSSISDRRAREARRSTASSTASPRQPSTSTSTRIPPAQTSRASFSRVRPISVPPRSRPTVRATPRST